MKLRVEDVAKMTGLSPSTVRQYAWERKIGKNEGRARVFTLAEAKRLGGLKDGPKRKSSKKAPTRKAKKNPVLKKAVPSKATKEPSRAEPKPPATERRSFWSFLGIGRKPRPKVGLMQVRGK